MNGLNSENNLYLRFYYPLGVALYLLIRMRKYGIGFIYCFKKHFIDTFVGLISIDLSCVIREMFLCEPEDGDKCLFTIIRPP